MGTRVKEGHARTGAPTGESTREIQLHDPGRGPSMWGHKEGGCSSQGSRRCSICSRFLNFIF